MEVDGAGAGRRQQQQEQQAGEGDAEAEAGPVEDAAAEEEDEEAMTPEKVWGACCCSEGCNFGVWGCAMLAQMPATLATCLILAFMLPTCPNVTCCCHPPTHRTTTRAPLLAAQLCAPWYATACCGSPTPETHAASCLVGGVPWR